MGANQVRKLAGDACGPPGPIIPTPAERALLRSYFEHTNRYLSFVDEASFWSALEEARYFHEHDDDDDDGDDDDDDGSDSCGAAEDASDGAGDDGGDEATTDPAAAASRDGGAGPSSNSSGRGNGRRGASRGTATGGALIPGPGIASLVTDVNAAALQARAAATASGIAATSSASASATSSSSSSSGAPSAAPRVQHPFFNPVAVAAGVVAAESVGDEEVAASAAARAHARALQRHSNAYGFRVLFHVLLSMACARQLPDKPWLSRHHYELARAYLGPCFAQPSTHLVSALLCLVPMTKALLRDAQKAALHASLALRMAEICDVGPELRCVAESINVAHAGPEKCKSLRCTMRGSRCAMGTSLTDH